MDEIIKLEVSKLLLWRPTSSLRMRTWNLVLMRKSVRFAGTKEKDDVNVRMYVYVSGRVVIMSTDWVRVGFIVQEELLLLLLHLLLIATALSCFLGNDVAHTHAIQLCVVLLLLNPFIAFSIRWVSLPWQGRPPKKTTYQIMQSEMAKQGYAMLFCYLRIHHPLSIYGKQGLPGLEEKYWGS